MNLGIGRFRRRARLDPPRQRRQLGGGGEGQNADSGMKIDGDRLLLRVVGWGGD